MKEVINSPWNYILIEHDENYRLSVLCGTSAMYNVNIMLSSQEVTQYRRHGINFVDDLAKDIQTYPSKYSDRIIEIPTH
jgi:hypothetical protein